MTEYQCANAVIFMCGKISALIGQEEFLKV